MKAPTLDPHSASGQTDPAVQSAEAATDETGKVPAVSVRGLTVSYGERPVLRSVSFDVPVGQIVGSMNSVRSCRDVIFQMVDEYIAAVGSLDETLAVEETAQ